jgi:thioredoxin reductase (NADPH)
LKDSKSFIITGRGLTDNTDFAKIWKLPREPDLLETSIPGVLAAGNVRAGAMNRVASAVGEGTMAIKMVHEYLTTV